ncbi:unnamed protein product [Gadus morhua 'NCC']
MACFPQAFSGNGSYDRAQPTPSVPGSAETKTSGEGGGLVAREEASDQLREEAGGIVAALDEDVRPLAPPLSHRPPPPRLPYPAPWDAGR